MQNPSARHQQLVEALLNHFRKNLGYNIFHAAFTGLNEPQKHGRHEPDIVATDSTGLIHIAEAKASAADILSETAKEQFEDFSNRLMAADKRQVIFHIVVFKEDEQALLNRLSQLGLGSSIGNRIKIWTL
jgi:hypothetical protein